MKDLLYCILGFIFLLACGCEQRVEPPPKHMTQAEIDYQFARAVQAEREAQHLEIMQKTIGNHIAEAQEFELDNNYH